MGEKSERTPTSDDPQNTALASRWARLLKRVFEIDVFACEHCGGRRRIIALLAVWLSLVASTVLAQEREQPRLVLQITVDALRGDLPMRHQPLMGDGGFRYLMERGVYFRNAHYPHANTETIVGHVSLATGAAPAAHGMVGNVWYDRELGRTVYNIEDPDYVLLTAGASVDEETLRPYSEHRV